MTRGRKVTRKTHADAKRTATVQAKVVTAAQTTSYPYRVFISFTNEDIESARRVALHLRSLGFLERYMETLAPGGRFREQIKDEIARAHLFVPILTVSAATRPWVHQEIGYAMGMNVPLLPLAIGNIPTGLADELQALRLSENLSNLADELTLSKIEYCVNLAAAGSSAVFEHGEYPEDRSTMLVSAAEKVAQYGNRCKVRQIARFGSFSLPDENPRDPVWDECEITDRSRSFSLRRDLRKERQVLEQHAREAGCKLILMPLVRRELLPSLVVKTRIKLLIQFLKSMPNEKIDVVILTSTNHSNLLLIGDWFLAESITPADGVGYLQTLGTWHAPTVLHRVREFDQEFDRLLANQKGKRGFSREPAIKRLESMLKNVSPKKAR